MSVSSGEGFVTCPVTAAVARSFSMIEETFVALADAMPAEKYAFKPTNGVFDDVRTFGEQVKHVACSNFGFFNEIEKKEPPVGCGTGGPHPATTKAEIMTYVRESFAYAARQPARTSRAHIRIGRDGFRGRGRVRNGDASAAALWQSRHELRRVGRPVDRDRSG